MLSGMAEFKSPSDSIRHYYLSVSWLLELASLSRLHMVVSQDLVRKIDNSRCFRGQLIQRQKKGRWQYYQSLEAGAILKAQTHGRICLEVTRIIGGEMQLLLKTPAEGVGWGEGNKYIGLSSSSRASLPLCCALAKHAKPVSKGSSEMHSLQ